MPPVRIAVGRREDLLSSLELPLKLDDLVPGRSPWEVEVGFGKGRYLLERAASEPGARFLGVEVASKYYRLVRDRARKRGLQNLLLVRGEALFLMSVVLPVGFASMVHVYFPDPWPKARHQSRRLLDPETVDLVLGLLKPGGKLCFATDHLEYGEAVAALFAPHPGVTTRRRFEPWENRPRTHYEAKYLREGRTILRLELERRAGEEEELLHPSGRAGVRSAASSRPE
jgi:tRNA (guanine-N7-)-methyltransferase